VPTVVTISWLLLLFKNFVDCYSRCHRTTHCKGCCHCCRHCPVAFHFTVMSLLATWGHCQSQCCFYRRSCHRVIVASFSKKLFIPVVAVTAIPTSNPSYERSQESLPEPNQIPTSDLPREAWLELCQKKQCRFFLTICHMSCPKNHHESPHRTSSGANISTARTIAGSYIPRPSQINTDDPSWKTLTEAIVRALILIWSDSHMNRRKNFDRSHCKNNHKFLLPTLARTITTLCTAWCNDRFVCSILLLLYDIVGPMNRDTPYWHVVVTGFTMHCTNNKRLFRNTNTNTNVQLEV